MSRAAALARGLSATWTTREPVVRKLDGQELDGSELDSQQVDSRELDVDASRSQRESARWPSKSPFKSLGKSLLTSLWKFLWKSLTQRWLASRPQRPRMLSLVARLEIGAKKSLLVVACGERRFLIANNAEGIGAMIEMRGPGRRRRPRADRSKSRSKPVGATGFRGAR